MATQSTKIGPGKVRVHVAAFGKHPGWDDHIEEIGLDSDELVRVKRFMYAEGMSGNIDAGSWEKLDEDKRLAAFRHVFYWKDRDSLIVGRFWSSSDGKGRTKYPMVVVAQVEGVPQWWAIEQILPRLEAAEARCTGGKTADVVRAAIGECRRGLEDAAAMLTVSPTGGSGESELLRRLAICSGLDIEGQPGLGLARILYEVEREMAPYKPGGSRTRTASVTMSPAHVRVPKCLAGPGEGARAWLALLKQELSDGAPMVVVEPVGQEWLDLVVGIPNATVLFCVRVAESGLAYTSRVPYTIPPEFTASVAAKSAAWASGQAAAAKPAPAAVVSEVETGSKGVTKWLLPVGGVALLTIGVAILTIARCGGGQTTKVAQTPAAPTDPSPPAKSATPELPKTEPSKSAPKQAPTLAPTKPEPAKPEPPKAQATKASDSPAAAPKPAEAPPAAVKPAAVTNGNDPRSAWTFRTDLQRATAALDALDAALAGDGGKPQAALRTRLTKINDRAELVRAMPWNDANSDTVRRGVEGVNQDLSGVEKDVGAALNAAHEKTRAALAAQPAPVKTEPFLKAWGEAVASVNVADGREAASKRLAELGAGLAETEKAFGADPFATPLPANVPIDLGAITATAAERRGAAMAEAARVAASGDAAKAGKIASDYTEWAAQAYQLARQVSDVAMAMVRGAGIRDGLTPTGADPTLGAVAEKLAASPAMKEFGPALGQVFSRVEELRAISASDSTDELVKAVVDGAEDSSPIALSKVLAAWDRLAAVGWPTDDAGLTRATELASGPVAKAVGKVPEPSRPAAVSKAAAASGRVWMNYISARGGTDEGLSKAIAAKAPLGLGAAATPTLPAWLRYNLALREFLADARKSVASPGTDAALRASGQKFLNEASELGPEVMARPGAAELLAGLKTLVEKAPQADVSKLGPGAAGWAYAPGKSGGAVFTWQRGGVDYSLTFLPVKTPTGSGAYVCTSELSVGLFIEAVNAANKWDDVRKVMSNLPIAGGKDLRAGVRAWVWTKRTPETMALARAGTSDPALGWLTGIGALAGNLFYSPDLATQPAPPAADSPIQYISPAAAVLVAKALGCRLPSSEEWLAAVGEKPGPANLRDATWKKQFTHVQELSAKGVSVPFPGAGAFWPAGATKPAPANDGEAAIDTDDGWLWFAPVDSAGAAFSHLVGNVAEWVTEDAPAMDALPPGGADALAPALGRGEKLRVIGGSALSAKAVDPRVPQAINWTQAKEGYADVGMRLAFSAPTGAAAGGGTESWKKLVDGAAFLPPPR